jgi:heme-degrading monooxygenase HmoA
VSTHIARIWRGRGAAAGVERYVHEHITGTLLPQLRSLTGFLGATILTRERDGETEVVVTTVWESLDAVKGFAGDDYEDAVVEPIVDDLLTRFDDHVEHFAVAVLDAPARPGSVSLEPDVHRRLARDLFNHTRTLLERTDRTDDETDRMVAAAHASRFFWEEIGEPVHHARSEWQLARAYVAAGRAEPALYHARRCLAICEEHAIGGFDLAYAHEALARAHTLAGESDAAAGHLAQARAEAVSVTDADDRELLLADLETIGG